MIADIQSARATLASMAALLEHHPRLAPTVARWDAALRRHLGSSLLTPETWAGLLPGSGGAIYRAADGSLVLLFHTPDLRSLLHKVVRKIRRQGIRTTSGVKPTQVAGTPALLLDGWTCQAGTSFSTCVHGNPARLEKLLPEPSQSLWSQLPSDLHRRYLKGRIGLWIRDMSALSSLSKAAGRLLGWTPRSLWLSGTLSRRLELRVVALGAPPSSGVSPKTLPRPGHSGLSAVQTAPLVLRLRMSPRRLGNHLLRLVPALAPVLEILRRPSPAGGTLGRELLNGELVLASDHSGIAALFGLRGPTRGQRASKQIMLLLQPALLRWRRRTRSLGHGWDLSYSAGELGDVRTHRITLRIPLPRSEGRKAAKVTLLWGLSSHHLILATSESLYRRALSRVDLPDASFLRSLPDSQARASFAGEEALAMHLRPTDPRFSLPLRQREAARRALGELLGRQAVWAAGATALADLTDCVSLTCQQLAKGLGCRLRVSLLVRPRATRGLGAPRQAPVSAPVRAGRALEGANPKRLSSPKAAAGARSTLTPSGARPGWHADASAIAPHSGRSLGARYLQALVKKWGGNRQGYIRLLRSIASGPDSSPLRARASRELAHRQGAPNVGLSGLLLSVYLPWLRHRGQVAARREAPRELARLAEGLNRLADAARGKRLALRRRWYRQLSSTTITPPRSCCAKGHHRCQTRSGDWSHPTWRRLGFRLSGAHRFRYQVQVEANPVRARVVLKAYGDLNCNGRSSLWRLVGTISAATGELKLGPIQRIREDP